jgi:hypothetical protein
MGRKIDLGCGYRLNPGHIGFDIVSVKKLFPGVVPPHYEGDNFVQWDLYQFPWPIADSSVEHAILRYFVEYIPHRLPDQLASTPDLTNHLDGFYLFFEELYRVMQPYAKVQIVHRLKDNGDPNLIRHLHQYSWQYLSKDWRDEAMVDDPNINFHTEGIQDDGDEALVILDTVK